MRIFRTSIAVFMLLVPSLAGAQTSLLKGKYTWSGTYVSTSPSSLCGGSVNCGGVNNATAPGDLDNFFVKLGKDLGGACGKGPLKPIAGFAGTVSKQVSKPGDTVYFTGQLIADGAGNLTGTEQFTSTSTSVPELLNFRNQGLSAICCGGPAAASSGSGAATCSALSKLSGQGFTTAIGVSATNAALTGGGYTAGSDGRGFARIWCYPVVPAGFNTTTTSPITFAESCNDSNLVIIPDSAIAVNHDGTLSNNIFSDEADTGQSTFVLQ